MTEKRSPWPWVAAAFLLASVRAHENGISLDPALFSSIARTFSREWVWWSQRASPELFPEYWEHPFLSLWLQGILFKLFGATDTTSRYLGLLAGPGSFYFLFRIGERLCDLRFARLLCFLSLLSAHFIGRMATFYKDILLTFFLLGALDFFLRALDERPAFWGAISGLFLGLAAWTKGLAVLPMAAAMGAIAVYRQRLGVFRSPALWLSLAGLVGLSAAYCGLQSAFGTYPACSHYIEGALFKKVMGQGAAGGTPQFLKVFLGSHPVHVLLALASFGLAAAGRAPKRAVVVGALASFAFLAAGATLGRTYYHYFYPIYPMVNLLAAASVWTFANERGWKVEWERPALGFAFLFLIVWQIVPFHMRRPLGGDWVQLAGPVKALKARGLGRLEAVSISDLDWIYREMSLWYWDTDSRTSSDAASVQGEGVIAPAPAPVAALLLARGYLLCASSQNYDVYVKRPEWVEVCRRAAVDPALVR